MTPPISGASRTIAELPSEFSGPIDAFRKHRWPCLYPDALRLEEMAGGVAGMNRVSKLVNLATGEAVVMRTLDSMPKPKDKLWETAITRCMGEQSFAPKMVHSSDDHNVMFLEFVPNGEFPSHPAPLTLEAFGRALRALHDLDWRAELQKTPEYRELQASQTAPDLTQPMLITRFSWMMEHLKAGLGPFLDTHNPFLLQIESYVRSLSINHPLCFCHLDLNRRNILNPVSPKIIDWTLGGPGIRSHEIASYVMAHPGVDFTPFYQGYCRQDPDEIPALRAEVDTAMPLALICRGIWGIWDFVGGFECTQMTPRPIKSLSLAEKWQTLAPSNRYSDPFDLTTHEGRRDFGISLLKQAVSHPAFTANSPRLCQAPSLLNKILM